MVIKPRSLDAETIWKFCFQFTHLWLRTHVAQILTVLYTFLPMYSQKNFFSIESYMRRLAECSGMVYDAPHGECPV